MAKTVPPLAVGWIDLIDDRARLRFGCQRRDRLRGAQYEHLDLPLGNRLFSPADSGRMAAADRQVVHAFVLRQRDPLPDRAGLACGRLEFRGP